MGHGLLSNVGLCFSIYTDNVFGLHQVKIWRRSFDVPPPPITPENPYYKIILEDPRYKDGPSKKDFPMFESLKLTIERTLPYWNDTIVPQVSIANAWQDNSFL